MRKILDPMRDSLHRTVHGVPQKSCPRCSRYALVAVFLPLVEFGERQITPGEFIPHTWCKPCRKTCNGAHYAKLRGA